MDVVGEALGDIVATGQLQQAKLHQVGSHVWVLDENMPLQSCRSGRGVPAVHTYSQFERVCVDFRVQVLLKAAASRETLTAGETAKDPGEWMG